MHDSLIYISRRSPHESKNAPTRSCSLGVCARCRVLQRVAVCCSVLQCVAVCCSASVFVVNRRPNIDRFLLCVSCSVVFVHRPLLCLNISLLRVNRSLLCVDRSLFCDHMSLCCVHRFLFCVNKSIMCVSAGNVRECVRKVYAHIYSLCARFYFLLVCCALFIVSC